MKLKYYLALVFWQFLMFVAFAADAVEPCYICMTNIRNEAVGYVAEESFYRNTTLRFTNCVAKSGTTAASAAQGLEGVTIQVKIGTATNDTVAYTGAVQVATSGTWYCSAVTPTGTTAYIQVRLTDAATNSYIYPWKVIRTKASL
jgi:hypothetical protein